MNRMDTGIEPANRLLNLVIAYGVRMQLNCVLKEQWLAGDIEMTFLYRYLAKHTRIAFDDIPTVIAYLVTGGYLQAAFEVGPEHSARLSLSLPPGSQLA